METVALHDETGEVGEVCKVCNEVEEVCNVYIETSNEVIAAIENESENLHALFSQLVQMIESFWKDVAATEEKQEKCKVPPKKFCNLFQMHDSDLLITHKI